MKTFWITFLHHASGNYGRVMDGVFGYSPKHWKWYNGTMEKYLYHPDAEHNKNHK